MPLHPAVQKTNEKMRSPPDLGAMAKRTKLRPVTFHTVKGSFLGARILAPATASAADIFLAFG